MRPARTRSPAFLGKRPALTPHQRRVFGVVGSHGSAMTWMLVVTPIAPLIVGVFLPETANQDWRRSLLKSSTHHIVACPMLPRWGRRHEVYQAS